MPCESHIDTPTYTNSSYSSSPALMTQLARMKHELDGIAAVLCSVLTHADKLGITDQLLTDVNAKAWWITHKMRDAEQNRNIPG